MMTIPQKKEKKVVLTCALMTHVKKFKRKNII